jgi:hypothetical protein
MFVSMRNQCKKSTLCIKVDYLTRCKPDLDGFVDP